MFIFLSICRLELCLFSFPPSHSLLVISCSKIVGIIIVRSRFLSAASFLLLILFFLFLLPSLLTEKNADSLRDRLSLPSFLVSRATV